MHKTYQTEQSIHKLKKYFIFLLSRREYSEQELINKGKEKKYNDGDVETVLNEFKNENLQSNKRFSDALIRSELRQLNGINKIKQKAMKKGISDFLIDSSVKLYFNENKCNWITIATAFLEKKHGNEYYKLDHYETQKVKRQLLNKGFTYEQINELF